MERKRYNLSLKLYSNTLIVFVILSLTWYMFLVLIVVFHRRLRSKHLIRNVVTLKFDGYFDTELKTLSDMWQLLIASSKVEFFKFVKLWLLVWNIDNTPPLSSPISIFKAYLRHLNIKSKQFRLFSTRFKKFTFIYWNFTLFDLYVFQVVCCRIVVCERRWKVY